MTFTYLLSNAVSFGMCTCVLRVVFLAFFFRSGRGDAHQTLEAILEELNADVKMWMAGDGESGLWRRIIRNLKKLKELREEVQFAKAYTLF